MSEIWKTIPNFSKYEVSTLGNIRNKKTLKELSKNALRCGYIRLNIINNDGITKMKTLHRLVALTFIPNSENKYTVNHINHDKLDNRVVNLEYLQQLNKIDINEKCPERSNV